ncbi:hypothetical protein [Mesoplasma lactucae]|uniref:Uncharacterized protein n=1 Tax=Mesoplasma lactucae ATCC 49193 TaxID=81460 RepID=A0A291IS77_9MOLU|nr:hypothetical protein [Mesoplasma lactucae]ATG97623.1 hypothetical protein CP520_02670 [Mesoplasma lactucae ATCC 49193]ATZ19916.1 hypothetical protein MLACT_v1c00920 [Mesoplasma lactucae ATCC 49193]MCL8216780.1 hypothetical protein [Mesoplasma lactucae ATCC 49193]
MKSNAAIRPLPKGSTNLKQTKEQNYEALLKATDNSEIEALFWQDMLSDLEEKYSLVYRPGNEMFQIYYKPGKSNAANKEILNTITKRINKINENWEKIGKTAQSFYKYTDKELSKELEETSKELKKLNDEREKFAKSLKLPLSPEDEKKVDEYSKQYAENRNKVQMDFVNNPHVKKMDEIQVKYAKKRQEILAKYMKGASKDFDKLLKELEFNEKEI